MAPSNLTMARILAGLGETDDAVASYRRAILGRWPAASEHNRLATRIELVEFLAKHGLREQLLAELLTLQEYTADDAIERRIAALYLLAGAPERSRAVWTRLRRSAPGEPDIYAGIGEAELAQRNFRAAQASFQTALRLRPGDTGLRERLALCNDVLALDPTRRGLSAAQRFDRSVALMALARASLERCPAAAASFQPTVSAARQPAHVRRTPRPMPTSIWRSRCGRHARLDALTTRRRHQTVHRPDPVAGPVVDAVSGSCDRSPRGSANRRTPAGRTGTATPRLAWSETPSRCD